MHVSSQNNPPMHQLHQLRMSGFTSGCGLSKWLPRTVECRWESIAWRVDVLTSQRSPSLSVLLTDWSSTYIRLLGGACVRSQPGTHTPALSLTHSLAMNSCRTGTVKLSGTSLDGCSSIHQFSVAHLLTDADVLRTWTLPDEMVELRCAVACPLPLQSAW